MKYCVTINDKRYEVEVEKGNAAIVNTTKIPQAAHENKNPDDIQAPAAKIVPKMIEVSEEATDISTDTSREVVKAPMAGGITDIKVSVGSSVKSGDVLLVLEAMKMENEITTHTSGVVAEIKVTKGSSVSAGEVLVVLK